MTIQELVQLYAMAPQVGALKEKIEEKSVKTIFLEGLVASSAPMLFASLSSLTANCQLSIVNFLFSPTKRRQAISITTLNKC